MVILFWLHIVSLRDRFGTPASHSKGLIDVVLVSSDSF
jgi:hypothetical protein